MYFLCPLRRFGAWGWIITLSCLPKAVPSFQICFPSHSTSSSCTPCMFCLYFATACQMSQPLKFRNSMYRLHNVGTPVVSYTHQDFRHGNQLLNALWFFLFRLLYLFKWDWAWMILSLSIVGLQGWRAQGQCETSKVMDWWCLLSPAFSWKAVSFCLSSDGL